MLMGDLVLTLDEVNPVIKALGDKIKVTAVHNHMIYEELRLFFLHFWATGDQSKLANQKISYLGVVMIDYLSSQYFEKSGLIQGGCGNSRNHHLVYSITIHVYHLVAQSFQFNVISCFWYPL